MSGRARAVASGYAPWYSAPACRCGHTNPVTNRSRASTTYARDAPARHRTPLHAFAQRAAAEIDGERDDLGAVSARCSQATATDVSSPPE